MNQVATIQEKKYSGSVGTAKGQLFPSRQIWAAQVSMIFMNSAWQMPVAQGAMLEARDQRFRVNFKLLAAGRKACGGGLGDGIQNLDFPSEEYS